jgi:hypothetical protein
MVDDSTQQRAPQNVDIIQGIVVIVEGLTAMQEIVGQGSSVGRE